MKERGSLCFTAAIVILITVMAAFVTDPTEGKAAEDTPVKGVSFAAFGTMQAVEFTMPEIPDEPVMPDSIVWYTETFKPVYLEHVTLPVEKMVLTDIGNYFVTSYCPAECGGSWTTASGTTCHRSSYEDRLTVPTTCAIDRKLHDFGDLFYIPAFDTVFIAEDTGSGVKGKWLDLFYEEYSDVVNFPTGYYQVYSVEYEYSAVAASKYDVRGLVNENLF